MLTLHELKMIQAAADITQMVTESGKATHEEESWLHETVDHHLFYAMVHITNYGTTHQQVDLQNALCRLAMANYVAENWR